MRKKSAKLFVVTIIIILLFTSISPMLASAVPSDIVNEDIAGYFKLSYNTKNGLPDDMVYDIATTSDGYMWFATASGLVRYDGEDYEHINRNTESGFNAVGTRCLFVDSKDNLWIGTETAGVICKTSGGYVQYVGSVFTSANSIRDIVQLSDGTIAVATANGLYFIEENGVIKSLENPENIYIQARTITVNTDTDELLCVTETGKIAHISNQKLTRVENYRDSENGTVTCLYYLGDGIYRIGTNKGMVIDSDLSDMKSVKRSFKTSFSSIDKMYTDIRGRWLVVGADGLGRINSSNKYTENDYFKGKDINAICNDFQGNYWFAINGEGLLEMGKSVFFDINEKYSLPSFSATCVLKQNSILYIGTTTGLIAVDESSGKMISNEFIKALEGKKINDLKLSLENRIIAATDADGIYAYGGAAGLKHYTQSDFLLSNHVNTICVMENFRVGIGYDDGVSIDINKNPISKFNEENGVAGTVVKIYNTGLADEVLIGTESNGGYRVTRDGKVTPFANKYSGFGSMMKAMIDSNNKKGLWLSHGSSLYYCEPDKEAVQITKLRFTHSIIDLFHSPDGRLWIITADKIVAADEDSLLDPKAELKADSMCGKDGLIYDISSKAYNYMSDDGMLYLCTNEGVLKINTMDYALDSADPMLAVTDIIADEKNIDYNNGSIELGSDVERLEISVSAISYYMDHEYKVHYKFDNAENYSSIDLDDGDKIVYTNLNGGEHKLKIELMDNETGNVVSKKEITIKKEYSIGEVKLFKAFLLVAACLLIAPLIYAFLSYRIYRSKKDHKRSLAIAEQAIRSFAKIIDAKDAYTKGHSERVADYTVEIAKRCGIEEENLMDLYYTALLHDIGKIGIPDKILKKPGGFTDEEYEIMKKHTIVGAEILKEMPIVKNIQFGARDHHEKYDGTGYPRGISGNEISLEGRIIGAADAYDAMTTLRGYNSVLNYEQIKKELVDESGKQFDPKIAKIVIDMMDEGYFERAEKGSDEKKFERRRKLGRNIKRYKFGRSSKKDGDGSDNAPTQ